MKGFDYILKKQIVWANRNSLKLVGSKISKGRQSYTTKLEDNLLDPLLPETKTEIEAGDGGELKGDATHSPKMCAIHSSSAFGVNVFQYWKDKNVYDIAYALGLCRKDNKSAKEIYFAIGITMWDIWDLGFVISSLSGLSVDGCNHRKEIEEFSEVAKLYNIKFHSMSYQQLIIKLHNEFYNGNEEYINYLIDRYL